MEFNRGHQRELHELLALIIENQELIVAAQGDIDAAVAAINALLADKTANPPVDTTALNAAVAAADAALKPADGSTPPSLTPGTPVLDANGAPVLDAAGNPTFTDANGAPVNADGSPVAV